MKQLILLRHAKSDWQSGAQRDFDRPLNKRGRRDVPNIARWLDDQEDFAPSRILCSAAARTRETLDLLVDALPALSTDRQFLQGLYHASLGDLHSLINKHLLQDPQVEQLMIIGHNPGLEWLVGNLDASMQGISMTTANIAWLLAAPSEQGVQWMLRHHIQPKAL